LKPENFVFNFLCNSLYVAVLKLRRSFLFVCFVLFCFVFFSNLPADYALFDLLLDVFVLSCLTYIARGIDNNFNLIFKFNGLDNDMSISIFFNAILLL